MALSTVKGWLKDAFKREELCSGGKVAVEDGMGWKCVDKSVAHLYNEVSLIGLEEQPVTLIMLQDDDFMF